MLYRLGLEHCFRSPAVLAGDRSVECCFCFALLATFGASVIATALRRLPSSLLYVLVLIPSIAAYSLLNDHVRSSWNLEVPSSFAAISMNIDSWSQSSLVQWPLLPSRLHLPLTVDHHFTPATSYICRCSWSLGTGCGSGLPKTKENMNQLQYSLNGS